MNSKKAKALRRAIGVTRSDTDYTGGTPPLYAPNGLGGRWIKVRKGVPAELADTCSRYRYKVAKRASA